jgi:hypothetical protein
MEQPQFCGGHFLAPTSGPNPVDLNGVYHFQGCCHQYDDLMRVIRKESIMIRMYEFKINGWNCPHNQAFYDQKKLDKEKIYEETYKDVPNNRRPPPPLIFKFNYPECCTSHTNPDFRNYINRIPYEINDALNDPETIAKFNQLYPDF